MCEIDWFMCEIDWFMCEIDWFMCEIDWFMRIDWFMCEIDWFMCEIDWFMCDISGYTEKTEQLIICVRSVNLDGEAIELVLNVCTCLTQNAQGCHYVQCVTINRYM